MVAIEPREDASLRGVRVAIGSREHVTLEGSGSQSDRGSVRTLFEFL